MSGATFGAVLREHRVALGLSQSGLARDAGCDPAYVNRLERDGRLAPREGIVQALAGTLGVDADVFLIAAGLCPAWLKTPDVALLGRLARLASDPARRRALAALADSWDGGVS